MQGRESGFPARHVEHSILRATQQLPFNRQAGQWSCKEFKRYTGSKTAVRITQETCLHKQPMSHMAMVVCAAADSSALAPGYNISHRQLRGGCQQAQQPMQCQAAGCAFPCMHCWQQGPVLSHLPAVHF